MGDAIGNSILFVILPLYVANLPAPWIPLPQSARVGFLIALYGLVSSTLQPGMGALCDRIGRRKPLILLGLFGIAFSALMVARLVSQIPVGVLSDKLGRKPLIIIGLVLLAPATALLGEARTTLQLTGLRIVQGLATAGTAAPSLALAADMSKAGGEGRQMSIITMGFGLGIAMGPLMAGVLAVFFFQLPFLVAGIMSLIGAWVVYRYVPETVRS